MLCSSPALQADMDMGRLAGPSQHSSWATGNWYESGTGTLAQVKVEQADVDMCTGRLVLANTTVIDKQGKV